MSATHGSRFVVSRKGFLTAAAALTFTFPVGLECRASNKASPMSAQQALEKLKEGNRRFVSQMTTTRHQTIAERAALGKGQAPFASILSCADSRTSPEVVFNQGLGDLFVVRVAGNVATETEKASLEYAAAELKSPLVVVMGHSACGAVTAAIELTEGEKFPGDIQELAEMIAPAARATKSQPGDWLKNATLENVRRSVHTLRTSPVLSSLTTAGSIMIVGGYYDVASGKVTFL